MAIELATAYVSLVPETTKLEAGIKAAFTGVSKQADITGKDVGNRLAKTASKAMRDGWTPDKDLMAGIPNTKLDRVGARIGQLIGKGVVGNMKAQEAGTKFAQGFNDGATSFGVGKLLSNWKSQLGNGNALRNVGAAAGKSMMIGLTGAATVGVGSVIGGLGIALNKGFDRLLSIDKAKFKLKGLGKSTSEIEAIVKTVTDSVTGTPFALDQAFGTAVNAIGSGVEDIQRYMGAIADAAGFAGVDIERMGLIFNQVINKGALKGEEMMQLMEAGLPARSWIQQSYNLTAQQFDKMQSDGEITMDMLQKSIEDHAPGMAKALGNSLQGSIDNMKSAVARVGANFLTAVFGGDSTDATDNMADSIQTITDRLNDVDSWVKSNGPQIQNTFKTIGQSIENAFKAGRDAIKSFMDDIKLLATGLGNIFGAMASANEFLDKIPGMGDLSNEANILRGWQQNLLGFGNPNPAAAGPPPNASRERRGLAPVVGSNEGLKQNAISLKDAIASMFPEITDIGGYRPNDPYPDHPSGRALDVMIPPSLVGTPEGKALGDRITQYALSSGMVEYAMWQQQNWKPGQMPSGMENRGDATQNHMDHVHIYTKMQPPSGAIGGGVTPGDAVMGGSQSGSDLLKRLSGLYDNGGVLKPGYTLVRNETGKDELVLNPDQQQKLADQGIDPGSLLHSGSGAAPGPAGQPSTPDYGGDFLRSMGFVPQSAGNTGVAGTSTLAKTIGMGNDIVGGIIDTGTNLAQTAVSAAIAGGTMGAGAAAGPAAGAAASYGIELAGKTLKRISSYGFQMAGIGADALMEQMMPFGAPRWLGYDYTAFAPQLGVQQALTGTLEKMGADAINQRFRQPTSEAAAPVQPNQLPGMAQTTTTPPEGQPHGGQGGQPPGPGDVLNNLFKFDQGGMLQPGQVGVNMTRRPEPVLTPQQWDAIAASSSTPAQVQPLVGNLYTQDMQDAIRQLDKVKRRDMMQYAGRP
jgi:tape measure domain-containing protein